MLHDDDACERALYTVPTVRVSAVSGLREKGAKSQKKSAKEH